MVVETPAPNAEFTFASVLDFKVSTADAIGLISALCMALPTPFVTAAPDSAKVSSPMDAAVPVSTFCANAFAPADKSAACICAMYSLENGPAKSKPE